VSVRDLLERYGPTVAVIATLTLLVVIFPTKSRDGATTLGATGGDDVGADLDYQSPSESEAGGSVASGGRTSGSGSVSGGSSATGGGGSAGSTGGAAAAGEGGAAPGNWPQFVTEGPGCFKGRQSGISSVMPPCSAPWPAGAENGGNTWKGVSKDQIIVVRFDAQENAATQAALFAAGANDTDEDEMRIYDVLMQYYNTHFQTYGREVKLVTVQASGPAENDEAMKADAIKIAEEIGAFAVFGSGETTVFTQEVTARGVVCLCTVTLSTKFYQDHPPYIFSSLPTAEDYFQHFAEYIGKRLAGKPAKWAGDATMAAQDRKFGLFWYGGVRGRVDPYRKPPIDFYKQELARYGVKLTADVMYLFELERAGEHSANMIAKMKNAGVSNLLCGCDPLYPIFLTKEATRQNYFPEWFISGTALIDTTFFGRTYDQAQWRNAYGISPLAVFWENVEASAGYREYHHAAPGSSKGDEGVAINVYRASVSLMFTGIQMAGPNLTADTFSQGMFNFPPSGGTPAQSLIFFTRESPTAVKDFTEVWWNPTGRGKDETGKDGAGTLMKAENGKRYSAGEWPSYDPKVFVAEGSIYTTDNPPGGFGQPHEDDGHTHEGQTCVSCS